MTTYRILCATAALGLVGANSGAAEVRGRVLVEGRPAAEVTITVLPFENGFERSRREARGEEGPEPLAQGLTRKDGSFRVPFAVSGATAAMPLRIELSGGGTAPHRLGKLVDPGGGDVGEVRLAPASPLAGRVQDARGGPVVGALVRLWAGRGGRFADDLTAVEPVAQMTSTGSDGTFRFDAASGTGNRIRIEAPGLATAGRANARGGALPRPVTLALGRVLRGSVALPDRRTAAPGALVRFEGPSTTRWHEVRSDGSFLIEGVPAGENGRILADGGEEGRAVAQVEAGTSDPIEVVLAPNAALAGRVVAADSGRPIPGVQVIGRAEEGVAFVARSGRDGGYRIAGVPPRSYAILVDDERFVPWTRGVQVSPGQNETQDIALVPGATLTGRVLSEEGAPVENATIQVSRGGAGGARDFILRMRAGTGLEPTAADGRFEVTRLQPGAGQRLDVRHDDYEDRSLGGIDLGPAATTSGVRVILRKGLELKGVIKDEEGRPISAVEVELRRPRSFRARRGGRSVRTMGPGSRPRQQTAADGRFTFRGLVAGDYTLLATRPGYGRAVLDPVKLAEDGSMEGVELVLAPGAAISGFIRDGAGDGAAGWYVSAGVTGQGGAPPIGPNSQRTEEATGLDGAFLLEGLVEGEVYDLQVMGSSGLGPRRSDVTAPADDLELVVKGNGKIGGRVTESESGQAVADFEVSYRYESRPGVRFFFSGSSGGPDRPRSFHAEDGVFVLENVPPGRWTVEVGAEGFQAGTASGVVVEEGGSTQGIDISLSKGGTISGQVLEDRGGRPILDATVRAELSGGSERPLRRVMGGGDNEARTDAEGQYEITGLAPGTWAVTASHSEWSEASVAVELEEDQVTADLRLGIGGALGGLVLAGGRPVAGAEVTLAEAGEAGRRGFGGGQGSLTGEDGRFRFERLSSGRYTLYSSLRSQSSDPVEAVVTGEADQQVTLILDEGATLSGTVSGLPEAELAGVSISASGTDGYFASSRTGADATFELTGVPEGSISLRATAGSFMESTRTATSTATIGPGQLDAYAEIVFEGGYRVEVRVSRNGQPVPEAFVNAFPESGARRSASARTDEYGTCVLEGLADGAYNFMATMQGGSVRETITVSGDATVDLEVPPGRIAGMLADVATGQPLGDVSVRIEESGGGFRPINQVVSDSAGRFALEDLEPRAYTLTFQKPAYETETREVTASEDSEIQVEMRRGEGLGLLARDGMFGTPLRGLIVRLVDAGGVPVFSGTVPLDSQGHGEIPSVKPGSYELRVSSSGYAPLVRPGIMVPASEVSLAFTPGGTLEVQAGPETLALPQPQGRLYQVDGRPYLPSIFSTDGLIPLRGPVRRLENVAPGRYAFAVEGGARQNVEVREGGLAVVTLP